MNEQEFSLLLDMPEGAITDFKATSYDLSNESKCIDLAKDIMCMANTPRQVASRIILGVRKFHDGTYELWGLDTFPDDADLQTHVANRISPAPHFAFEIILYQGKRFGVITIPVQQQGPYLPVSNFGEKLQKQKVYFRRGSKNDLATPVEIANIYSWMEHGIKNVYGQNVDAWDNFLQAASNFEASQRYILFTAHNKIESIHNLPAIGRVPWTYVFDFDPNSDTTGLLNEVRETLEERLSLHQIVAGEYPTVNPDRATYWFYARGLVGRDETVRTGTFKEWAKLYRQEIYIQLQRIASAVNPSPVTCVVLWYEPDLIRHLQSSLESAVGLFGDSLNIVIATEQTGALEPVATELETKLINIPLHELCSGLEVHFSNNALDEDNCILSTGSGAPVSLSKKDQLWIQEELDIVHKNVGTTPLSGRDIGRDFLRGSEITWYELSNHWDVDRDKSSKLERIIKADLEDKRTLRINLYHAPGAGGTTLARRLLWNLHGDYPCAVLLHCEPAITVDRLYKLTSVTGKAVLLLIDSSQIEERQVEDLFTILRARQIPVVMLQTLRRFSVQAEKERSSYLPAELTLPEARRLIDKLLLFTPNKRAKLEALLISRDSKSRTPFYVGLEAFERDFVGLETYINNKLSTANSKQLRVLCYLALAHHYAQRPIQAQAFATLFGIPKNRIVKILDIVPESCHDLIVESRDKSWRTAHDLIATEIIRWTLSNPSGDRRIWYQNLSLWAKDFIDFCRGDDPVPSSDMVEIARRTFIYRDNTDLLGSERSSSKAFAQLLEDIPSKEGRLEVLKMLVAVYPEEPHFWSHLGRYYSIQMQDYTEALRCADKAITLQDADHVLYHMRGMIIRYRINSSIEQNTDLTSIVEDTKLASASFEKARELNSDDEHGFISEVQMLIKVLDYAGRKYPKGVLEYLSLPTADVFLREAIQRAEDLLEQIRRNREGERPSSYEEDSRAKLNALYGKHDSALQIWNNLLSRQDTYRPPLRRQIVWTYLARRNRSWSKLEPREVDKIMVLLNDNIDEDPSNERDLRLWVQAIRRANNPPSMESIIERLGYWRANSHALDAVYYLYVFYSLLTIEGSAISREDAIRFIDESKQMARFKRNRTKSFEWISKGTGLGKLIHQSELGEWDDDKDFWENTKSLEKVKGRIAKIDGPQAGKISVEGGLSAFFVPSRSGHSRNRSENEMVDFYLGFSYDGLRAWEVGR